MGLNLPEYIAHLLAISVLIALVYSVMRKETPAAAAVASVRFFLFILAVVAGITAVLYVMSVL
jgi:hypothetical protein